MSAPLSQQKQTIVPIQALRAIAALWVMLFHYTHGMSPNNALEDAFSTLAGAGFFGVDLFFVISGYIVSSSWKNNGESAPKFLLRRAGRIYLGYWPVLFALCIIMPLMDITPAHEYHWLKSAFLVPQDFFQNPITVVWTLYHELIFYALFVVAFSLSASVRQSIIGLVMLALCSTFLWYGINGGYKSDAAIQSLWLRDSPWITYGFTPFLIEFVAGCLIHSFRVSIKFCGLLVIVSGVAALYINAHFFDGQLHQGYREFWRVLVALPFASLCVIMAIQPTRTFGEWYFTRRLLKPIGDASYSLYLLHMPFLMVFGQPVIDGQKRFLPVLAYSAACVLLSVIWFRMIEHPINAAFKGALRQHKSSRQRT